MWYRSWSGFAGPFGLHGEIQSDGVFLCAQSAVGLGLKVAGKFQDDEFTIESSMRTMPTGLNDEPMIATLVASQKAKCIDCAECDVPQLKLGRMQISNRRDEVFAHVEKNKNIWSILEGLKIEINRDDRISYGVPVLPQR